MALLGQVLRHGPRQSEIAYLDSAIVSQEQVARLDVSVDDVCSLQVVYCAEEVIDYYFRVVNVE